MTTELSKEGGNATGVSRPPPLAMYVCNIFFAGDLGSLTVSTTRDPFSIFEGTTGEGVGCFSGVLPIDLGSIFVSVAMSKCGWDGVTFTRGVSREIGYFEGLSSLGRPLLPFVSFPFSFAS